MVDSTIPNLVAVTVPAVTDLFGVRQSGDTRDKKLTVTQLLTLIPGGGDVSKVGTPVDNQIGVWTGDGTIEGDPNFIWDGTQLIFLQTGDLEATPTISFGAEADSGFYKRTDDQIFLSINSLEQFKWIRSGTEGRFSGTATGSGLLRNIAASATVPSLCPDSGDVDTGIGQSAADELSLIAGGQEAVRYDESLNEIVQRNFHTVGVTASITQTQGQGDLESSYNEVAVVANANDVVTAPFVQEGVRLVIVNNGANVLQVFPETGDDFGAGVNASITIAAGSTLTALGRDGINWDVLYNGPSSAGAGDVTKVGTPVDNQIGVWTGDGTIEGDANFTWDGSHLLLPQTNDAVTPTLAFGDGDTGFYENADDFLSVALGGVRSYAWSSTTFGGIIVGAGSLFNEASSATNPTLIPNNQGVASGVGGVAGEVALIAGALSCLTVAESGGARQVGFYATAPISLQTGVAVSSAGIHAALVALGLITA